MVSWLDWAYGVVVSHWANGVVVSHGPMVSWLARRFFTTATGVRIPAGCGWNSILLNVYAKVPSDSNRLFICPLDVLYAQYCHQQCSSCTLVIFDVMFVRWRVELSGSAPESSISVMLRRRNKLKILSIMLVYCGCIG